MATLSSNLLTLADWAKRLDPDGKVPLVAELLTQSNEILEDAVFGEGNLPTGHRVVIRTGLPNVYWRSINQGIPTSKSTTVQVDESVGMLEAYARVDVDLAKLNGNIGAFRESEDSAFLEAMNQTQAATLFYGNPATDPRQYLGLAPRYSLSTAGNGNNIIKGGGSGSVNTSVWLVVWGDNQVFCPFPKGSMAGILREDQGQLTVYDASQNPFQAYQTHYQWKNGLVVKDWRYVVRICNIDTTNLVANAGSQADLITLMSRALDRVPNLTVGRAAFYMNRTVYSLLRVQALAKSNYALAVMQGLNQFGTPTSWLSFEGVPLRRVDQLLNTEATVS